MKMHTWPYFMLLYGLWFISLKRFLYLWWSGKIEDEGLKTLGIVYMLIMFITVVIKVSLGIPNLYGARLFESHPWTVPLASVNSNIYLFLTVLCPLLIYARIANRCKTIIIRIDRPDRCAIDAVDVETKLSGTKPGPHTVGNEQ